MKILFTRESTFPLKKADKEASIHLKNMVEQKYIDIKKGLTQTALVGKTLWIIACIEAKTKSFDKLQCLGATVAKTAKSKVHKKEKGDAEVIFDKSLSETDVFFLEKGIRMALPSENGWKSKNEEGSVTFRGLKNKELEIVAQAIDMARTLVSKPANILTPDAMEDFAKDMVKADKHLKITVLKEKDLKAENMNMHLAVNSGSPNEARMIIVEYTPSTAAKKTAPIALIGKGLMYDSGGYYPKPYPHMNDMYGDMGGAATVLAVMSVLSHLKVNHRVVGVCGIAENMIDGKSYRNGDILTSRKGLTVEVNHSDAEGRLVLGDVLHYTEEKFKPLLTFDFATLTGAVVAALGETYTGIFTDNKNLISTFKKLGESVNDKVWDLPFDDDVKEAVKGKAADIANTSKLPGILGASTAAAFLSNFVKDTKKWVHFDIAGTAHRDKMKKSYDPKTLLGTGAMVHLMLEYLKK